jgi:hypothetical protein
MLPVFIVRNHLSLLCSDQSTPSVSSTTQAMMTKTSAAPSAAKEMDVDMDMDVDEDVGPAVSPSAVLPPSQQLVPSFQPTSLYSASSSSSSSVKASPALFAHQLKKQQQNQLKMVVCQFCGRTFSEDEIEEHLKYEMRDKNDRLNRLQAMEKVCVVGGCMCVIGVVVCVCVFVCKFAPGQKHYNFVMYYKIVIFM